MRIVFTLTPNISSHDLRRTFATYAKNLGISTYTIKHMMNHKDPNDVTQDYIASEVEAIREPMQKITDFIRKAADIQG